MNSMFHCDETPPVHARGFSLARNRRSRRNSKILGNLAEIAGVPGNA
jgi:hypothetical protein